MQSLGILGFGTQYVAVGMMESREKDTADHDPTEYNKYTVHKKTCTKRLHLLICLALRTFYR